MRAFLNILSSSSVRQQSYALPNGVLFAARRISVLDSQYETASGHAGQEEIEERRPYVAKMEAPCRARREPCAQGL
jgi:hypothetical protein